MSHLITWENPDGSVQITIPAFLGLDWSSPWIFGLETGVPVGLENTMVSPTLIISIAGADITLPFTTNWKDDVVLEPGQIVVNSEDEYLDLCADVTKRKTECVQDCERKPNADFSKVFNTSRRFRNQWRRRKDNGEIEPDVSLAQQTRMLEIRAERDGRLVESDKEKARLDDIGTPEQIAALKDYRQQLRDLPATAQTDVAAITTPDGLDLYQPPWPVKP